MLKTKKLLTSCFKCFSEASEYQKRRFEFEENWKAVSDEKNQELIKNLEEHLTQDQKNYLSALAKAFVNLTIYELKYYHQETVKVLHEVKGVPLMTLMTDWPSVKKNGYFKKCLTSKFIKKNS
jgi:transcription termination factor NusB